MRLSILAVMLNLIFFSNNFIFSKDSNHSLKNGTIVEKISGFPYSTYDDWLQAIKSRYLFDESEFKKKYPPEDFDKYKESINCPFDTFEEWIQAIRRRFSRSLFDEMAFRKKYPLDDFIKYKKEIEYIKIIYLSDGLKVEGFILKPKNTQGKKFPSIIYNRGGNQDIALLDFEKLYDFFDLVSKGYILIASQYRGCGESEGHDELGGSDVNDVINLIPLIESLAYADATRIGMIGWSRGGMMTYIVLTKTDRISAAVIGAGPTDFFTAIEKRPDTEKLFLKLIPSYKKNKNEVLKSRSAMYWPEKLHKQTPILLLQGSADWRTDPTSVLRMAELLYKSKHPFRFVFFEGGDHGLTHHKKEVDELMIGWMNKYVRDSMK